MKWPFEPFQPYSFDVVLADPPWLYKLRSVRGEKKSAQARYGCMPMEEIAALPVGDLIAPGGVLVLWCTWPMLAEQILLPGRWGLKYNTGGVWEKLTASGKQRWGTGYVLRSVCEPFLIATLPKHKWRGAAIPNLLPGLAREHSRKPEEMYAMLERALPGARRLDLFSRQSRAGWEAWGNEAGKFDMDQPPAAGPPALI